MHFSARNVIAAISVTDSDEVLLAKMALGFANLSKMVKTSSFNSISSGTASIRRSASRQTSSTLCDVAKFAIALSLCSGATLPRETPFSNASLI